jgi:hypothetical protein
MRRFIPTSALLVAPTPFGAGARRRAREEIVA